LLGERVTALFLPSDVSRSGALSQQLQQLIDTLASVSRLPPHSNDLGATYIGIRLASPLARELRNTSKDQASEVI